MKQEDRSTIDKYRDRFAWAVCNFMLNHVATEWYCAMIDGSIRLGMKTAQHPEAYDLVKDLDIHPQVR